MNTITSETGHVYAPVLATVHNYLFDNWGPFSVTWRNGLLCPFAPDIGLKNITCSQGRRDLHLCGLLIEDRHAVHLPNPQRKKMIGRVMCNPWAHHLIAAYWDIPNDELLSLPDNPSLVAYYILSRVIRATMWYDWLTERRKRLSLRPYQYNLRRPLVFN